MSNRPRTNIGAVIMSAGIATVGSIPASAQSQDQPNLIFILTDDQGTESIDGPNDSQGNPIWGNEMGCFTPTLYRMSEIGVSFTNCRVNPNCSPTRAGLMTGRRALSTGVTGVLAHFQTGGINPCVDGDIHLIDHWAQATDLTSMQTYERTIAEALHDAGYYTVLIDKWHVGGDHYGEQYQGEDRGTSPDNQGFDFYDLWLDAEYPDPGSPSIFLCNDDPNQTGDEHMVAAAQQAVDVILNRDPQHAGKPYALFFHTITPHTRAVDDDGSRWWQVAENLIPLTKHWGTNPTEEKRFIQNVEAIDTVIRDFLLEPLDVITPSDHPTIDFEYRDGPEDPDTVVFFLGDNGTHEDVSWYGEGRAKNSPYEGGIRVPLIVFGEGVPFNENNPVVDDRLVSHLDFFDTIADVAGIPDGAGDQKRNTVNDPFKERHGNSFADAIGYEARGID